MKTCFYKQSLVWCHKQASSSLHAQSCVNTIPSSENGLPNHFRKIESRNPNLHLMSFGYSINSHLSTLSRSMLGNFLSNSVCNTTCNQSALKHAVKNFHRLLTCMANLFNCAFLLTDSISPTAKPISKFMRRIGISTMNRPRIRKAGMGNGRDRPSSFK